MRDHYDFKKEWESIKSQLVKFTKEASVLAKKGEKEIVKFSKAGKLHLDAATINFKRERLYYFIGKEYIKSFNRNRQQPSEGLQQLVNDLKQLNRGYRSIQKEIEVT